MKKIAILDYMFIFEPDTTWQSGSAFERDLADFYAAHGYDCQVIEPRGNSGKRIIFVTNIDALSLMKNDKNKIVSPRQVSPQKILKKMSENIPSEQAQRFNKGRFLKTKGYLKK